eukprot:scaffold422888_cov83-Attheya_sp.AAC.1
MTLFSILLFLSLLQVCWTKTHMRADIPPLCEESEKIECHCTNKKKFFVCHYDDELDSYKSLCIPDTRGHSLHPNDYCGPCLEYEVAITSPLSGVTTGERAIDIVGLVQPLPTDPSVATVRDIQSEVSLTTGEFVIPVVLLTEGANELHLRVISQGETIADTIIDITFHQPSEASGPLNPDLGVSVEVTNTESALYGAGINIPAGVAARSFEVSVLSDPEHMPALPFGADAVGPPVTVFPHAEEFSGPVELMIPFDPSLLPEGATESDIILQGSVNGEWSTFTAVVDVIRRRLVTEQTSLTVWSFIATASRPLSSGEVLIDTSPGYATVYIDGENKFARTPVVLDNVPLGNRQAKIYLQGYDEVFYDFVSTESGAILQIDLTEQSESAPLVQISTADGSTVSEGFIQIQASVLYNGNPVNNGTAIISVNGDDSFHPVTPGGNIAGFVTLSHRENVVVVRVNGQDGSTGTSSPITVTRSESGRRALRGSGLPSSRRMANNEVIIRLSWNTDTTDIDLHVFDPNGNHAYYGDQGGIPGALIDVDDVNGFGPEIFTFSDPVPGTYTVAVDSYRIGGIQTTASLTITVGSLLIFSGSYVFTADDFNASGGTGPSTAAFWDATSFEVGELIITQVSTQIASPASEAIFTTAPDENLITIVTKAPESIPDSSILYEVSEVNENFSIDTTALSGRVVSFEAAHSPVSAGDFKSKKSTALEYKITAYSVDGDGNRQYESEPAFIKQDLRSWIRQEYIDKKSIFTSFARATPERDVLLDASQYVKGETEKFTFSEYARYSDFAPAIAVIDRSRIIANTLREAWGDRLVITSGWRNPRRNDRLTGSSKNSFHQSGDALDFNPWSTSANWPDNVPGSLCGANITSFSEAQEALTCVAKSVLPDATYDFRFHLNHLHIEYDP